MRNGVFKVMFICGRRTPLFPMEPNRETQRLLGFIILLLGVSNPLLRFSNTILFLNAFGITMRVSSTLLCSSL
jgi:hypothetical protein